MGSLQLLQHLLNYFGVMLMLQLLDFKTDIFQLVAKCYSPCKVFIVLTDINSLMLFGKLIKP